MQKSLIFNLKSNLDGIFKFLFQKLLTKIGEYNRKSKCMDMIYKLSWCITFVIKSLLSYASKLHSITSIDNMGILDYPKDFLSQNLLLDVGGFLDVFAAKGICNHLVPPKKNKIVQIFFLKIVMNFFV